MLRRTYSQMLRMAGYEVSEARGGFEALRTLDSARPDLVLLDLLLPGIDGVTVRHELAAHAGTRNIPIIIVTAADGPHDHLDVACVLKKPVTPDALIAAVRSCLVSGAGPAGA